MAETMAKLKRAEQEYTDLFLKSMLIGNNISENLRNETLMNNQNKMQTFGSILKNAFEIARDKGLPTTIKNGALVETIYKAKSFYKQNLKDDSAIVDEANNMYEQFKASMEQLDDGPYYLKLVLDRFNIEKNPNELKFNTIAQLANNRNIEALETNNKMQLINNLGAIKESSKSSLQLADINKIKEMALSAKTDNEKKNVKSNLRELTKKYPKSETLQYLNTIITPEPIIGKPEHFPIIPATTHKEYPSNVVTESLEQRDVRRAEDMMRLKKESDILAYQQYQQMERAKLKEQRDLARRESDRLKHQQDLDDLISDEEIEENYFDDEEEEDEDPISWYDRVKNIIWRPKNKEEDKILNDDNDDEFQSVVSISPEEKKKREERENIEEELKKAENELKRIDRKSVV